MKAVGNPKLCVAAATKVAVATANVRFSFGSFIRPPIYGHYGEDDGQQRRHSVERPFLDNGAFFFVANIEAAPGQDLPRKRGMGKFLAREKEKNRTFRLK